jgi:hypothetical protein
MSHVINDLKAELGAGPLAETPNEGDGACEGVKLLELAPKTHELFLIQPAREKRRLLNLLLSNCTWKRGELDATFRQPFNMLSDTTKAHRCRSLDAGIPNLILRIGSPG